MFLIRIENESYLPAFTFLILFSKWNHWSRLRMRSPAIAAKMKAMMMMRRNRNQKKRNQSNPKTTMCSSFLLRIPRACQTDTLAQGTPPSEKPNKKGTGKTSYRASWKSEWNSCPILLELYFMTGMPLQGIWHNLSSNFSFFSRMVNMNFFDALSKFECQISNYKQDTEVRFLCFVNKAWILLLFTFV